MPAPAAIRFLLSCLLIATCALAATAHAADPAGLKDGVDVKGASDHPLVQRFKGASIRYYDRKAFDELRVALGPVDVDGKGKSTTAEGVHTTLVYVLPKDVSVVEAARAYRDELARSGELKVLFQGTNDGSKKELDDYPNAFVDHAFGGPAASRSFMAWNSEYRYTAYRIKRPEGDLVATVYAGFNADASGADDRTVPTGRTGVRIDIVEPKPMAARMVTVKSEEMAAEIRKNGRIALYGILFDTNRAEPKPEASASLQEIARLMAADPNLRLMVVGHTDTVGAFEANRDLSQRRAKAVVAALVAQYKVDATRLQAFGASFAAPVASNVEEAGRAKNRRVELVAF